MKKNLKIILIIAIALVTFYCIIIAIDINRVSSLKSPIFVIPVNTVDDGGSGDYYGLGYKVIMEVRISAEYGREIKKTEMYMFNKCIAGAIE